MHPLLIALICVGGIWLAAIAALLLVGKPAAARDVVTLVPNLAALFRGVRADPSVPRGSKLLIVALAWIASPIDLIPEFIPVLGPLDDALVAAFVLRRLVRAAGSEVVTRHWRGSAESLAVIFRLSGIRPG